MVIKSYDRPMGHPDETGTERSRRHPSQPNSQDSRRSSTNEINLHTEATLNQKTLGSTMGRDLLPETKPTMTQKSAKGKRTPHYVLRTVTPSNPEKSEQRLRPEPQHVPGSYRSEFEPVLGLEAPILCPPSHKELALKEPDHSKHQALAHSSVVPHTKARDALQNIEDHRMPMSPRHHIAPKTLHPLIPKTSQSSLGSHLSGKHARHPLLQPSAESTSLRQSVEPSLTTVIDFGHDNVENELGTLSTIVTQVTDSKATLPAENYTELTAQDFNPSLNGFQPGTHNYAVGDPHVAELLAEVPPFTSNAMDHINARPVMTDLDSYKNSDQEVSEIRAPSVPSVNSRRSSLRLGAGGGSRKSSFDRAQAKKSSTIIYEQEHAASVRPPSKSSPEADVDKSMGRKLFTNSHITSRSTELSPHPETDTSLVSSFLNSDNNEHELDSFRLQKSPSLVPIDGAAVTNEVVYPNEPSYQRKLWSPLSYQVPDSAISKEEIDNEQPKSHWVKQLLRGQSPASMPYLKPTNLTTKPLIRQKQASTNSAHGKSANTVTINEKLLRFGDAGSPNQQTTDSSGFAYSQMPQPDTESFSRIILELEALLKEALNIAHQAAEKEEVSKHPDSPDKSLAGPPSSVDNYHRYLQGNQEAEKREDMEHKIDASYRYFATPDPSIPDLERSMPPGQASELPTDHTLIGDYTDTRVRSLISNRVDLDSKENAAHINVPQQGPIIEFPTFSPNEHQIGASRSSLEVLPERISIETPPDFQDLSLEINNKAAAKVSRPYPEAVAQSPPRAPIVSKLPVKEQQNHLLREPSGINVSSREDVLDYISVHNTPPIQPRSSSARLRINVVHEQGYYDDEVHTSEEDLTGDMYIADFHQSGLRNRGQTRQWPANEPRSFPGIGPGSLPQHDTITSLRAPPTSQNAANGAEEANQNPRGYNLKNRHHFSIRGSQGFSLSRSHQRAPIARDWSVPRKRFVATVTCINTALIGLIVGIYAGEVPAIQYAIVDENHYAIQGNVVFFIGMAITTFFCFPLPLLHGRKPYTLTALGLLLPLQFPQAVAVGQTASPYLPSYRVGLLVSRAFAGILAGFLNINLKTTLLDLFGASLQSGNPHQETVNENDVRRHGGGMGLWLGIWVWCSIGSIGVGFLIGAAIISARPVTWGFWTTIMLTAAVLILNVMTPEVRRSPYRRSMAEVDTGTEVSRRIARGEIKMHLYSTGPKRGWEEVVAGYVLCFRMLKQPGFLILTLYMGWIYGQVIMVIVLLGALTSKYYYLLPQYVGLCVAAIPIGALLAIPFQKASLFSHARHHAQRTDSMTFEKRVTWTSHLIRRSTFMFLLPFAGLAYTLGSCGPDTSFMVPTIFAGIIGFLSCLAIAECNGLIMETYDTSDLQPGMTGRPRRILPEDDRRKRTNFSCFPRVTSAFAINHTFSFLIAAAATGAGGAIERRLGAQAATGVVAGVLLVLTLLLIAALTRFKTVQIVPTQRYGTNVLGGPEDEWKPIIIGHPSGTTRRLSLLEMGSLTRWSEIRRRNRLMEG